jgi:hypothetical protein
MKRAVIVVICLLVGGLHFLVGPQYGGPFPVFVNGYLIDLMLPFAMFLLLGLAKQRFLRRVWVRAAAVLMVGAAVETLQYFGVPVLGSVFDPLDYLAYAAGVVAGMVFESLALSSLPER